jgi:hypothetical protein
VYLLLRKTVSPRDWQLAAGIEEVGIPDGVSAVSKWIGISQCCLYVILGYNKILMKALYVAKLVYADIKIQTDH